MENGDLVGFLNRHPPFNGLPDTVLQRLAARMQSRRVDQGAAIVTPGVRSEVLYLIRFGAVEVRNQQGELRRRIGEGGLFGAQALLRGGLVLNHVRAIEPCLLLQVPLDEFHELRNTYSVFADFCAPEGAERLHTAMSTITASTVPFNLTSTRVDELALQPVATAHPGITIRQAAEQMMVASAPALVLMEQEKIKGLVTPRDLSSRAIATGLDYNLPISMVMTPNPVVIEGQELVFDAMLAMVQHNINHMPVLDGQRLVGLLTSQDITLKQHGTSAVYLVGRISRMNRVEELAQAVRELPHLVISMVAENSTAQNIGRVITLMSDAVTGRLLRLAEERLGRPPVPYAWMAAGSQGRREQTAHGDQDNCLILDNRFDPERHGDYFEALSRFVCDALNTCGYVYCPGEMMACSPLWRMPLALWQQRFGHWITEPSPKALLLTTIFFDLRLIYGHQALFDELQHYYLAKARDSSIFLAHMASNALGFSPPLGFFRNFVLERSGTYRDTLNLKSYGVTPIVDLARVYALAGGVATVNTHERLQESSRNGKISPAAARDLSEALEFISFSRVRHQAQLLEKGQKANNYLAPNELSEFERQHLKDAFRVVQTMQKAMTQSFQTQGMS